MKSFLTFFFLGLFCIAAFNIYIDPVNRWHRWKEGYHLLQNWGKDEALLIPRYFMERRHVTSHLQTTLTPEVLVLGSSRAKLVDSAMFQKGTSFFNAGVAGATMEDLAAIYQFLEEQKKIPKRVIIFLDPWVFNANNGLVHWQENLELYERFASAPSERRNGLFLILKRTKYFLSEIADLFSWSILKKSIRIVMSGKIARPFSIVKLDHLSPHDNGIRSDGSTIDSAEISTPPSLETISKIAADYTAGCVYGLCRFEFSSKNHQTLVKLLSQLKTHDVKVMFILPPYQHMVWRHLEKSASYREILPEIEKTMLVLKNEFPFTFCKMIDPVTAGCDPVEFSDGAHMLRSCTEKVMRKCLDQTP